MSRVSEVCLVERMHIASMSSSVSFGQPGIAVAGAGEFEGAPPLLLIWDERGLNKGVSATNACETVLSLLAQRWRGSFPVLMANVVECDSEGSFDHVQVNLKGHIEPQVNWAPIRFPGEEPRSLRAFRLIFGVQAHRALTALQGAGVACPWSTSHGPKH